MKPVDTDSQGIQTPPGDWEGQGHWRGTFQVVTSSGPKIYKCGGSAAFPPAEDPPFLLWVVALHGGGSGGRLHRTVNQGPQAPAEGGPTPHTRPPGLSDPRQDSHKGGKGVGEHISEPSREEFLVLTVRIHETLHGSFSAHQCLGHSEGKSLLFPLDERGHCGGGRALI